MGLRRYHSPSSFLFGYLAASALIVSRFIVLIHGHGIEVRQCVTPDGNLRFFVEHWHDDLANTAQPGTMQIHKQETGLADIVETKYAQAIVNNRDIYDTDGGGNVGWGCVNDDTPDLVTSCHHDQGVVDHIARKSQKERFDWVYFDRSATCNVEITYTLIRGDTYYLEDGCDTRNVRDGNGDPYTLYPAIIGPTNFTDRSAPVPKIDGTILPQTISVVADSPAEPQTAVVEFVASATDDCDENPSVSTDIASGYAFPVGSTTVTVTATDNVGNTNTGILTVIVSASPTSSPTNSPSKKPTSSPTPSPSKKPTASPSGKPTTAPTSSPSKKPTSSPSNKPTSSPSQSPIKKPTASPSKKPTTAPTSSPSKKPTSSPSNKPTSSPSQSPSKKPTASPSKKPTGIPTASPSIKPTSSPSMKPSSSPTTPIPTSKPTMKPTSNPTERPTDVPSLQPSIVEQTVTIGGSLSVNRNVCAFSAAQLSDYVAAALDSIKQVTGCSDSSECQAEITNVCGNTRRSLSSSSSRNLQSSTAWQLDYEITQTFTCEYASCNSASDSASTESIVASIAAPIEASLSDDGFLTVLSVNILTRGSFTADFVACFAVWGVVNEPDLDVTPGIDAGTGQYFPDWEGGSGTCLQGEPPYLYMELNPEVWLYDTLEGCCERYYGGWNKNKCLNLKGSGLWYVSYMKEKCVTDCEEGKGSTCGGLANPISDDLFADPRSCCENELGWRYLEFCEAESLGSSCYAGTGKYYRGDTAGVEVCVRDCDAAYTGDDTCGGLVEDDYIVLHETPEECCELEYDWMTVELCAARTTHTDANVYWPDMIEAKCLLDAQTPAKDLSIPIYDTAADCCEESVHWLSEGECLTASGVSGANINATNKYFVDWVQERCIQDCEGSAPCGGVGLPQMSWSDLFDTASECCDRISWVPKKDCIF